MVNRRLVFVLALLALVALTPFFAHRVTVVAAQLWARLHPSAVQTGGLTVETDQGTYELPNVVPARAPVDKNDLNDNLARVGTLMSRMPSFNKVVMPPGIRWFRYRPAWFLDMAMETSSGQVWVTYWPKGDASHPPEYLGKLYGGVLSHYLLPQEPYYFLNLDYHTGPIPVVNGLQLETGKHLHWAILSNGPIIDSLALPAALRGSAKSAVCRQGSPSSGAALYGLLPDGRWQPILSWSAWRTASLGIWRYNPNYPLECVGRFGGYFWVTYEAAGQGALYRVAKGVSVPFAAGRAYLVTDHVMIISDGDQIIEAHSP